ncbi:Alpha/Beta hydrolase protein [Melanogaster broomeanus]|nr:Alpha/Beta hydrolase protein [Melanogaster broomeanus]
MRLFNFIRSGAALCAGATLARAISPALAGDREDLETRHIEVRLSDDTNLRYVQNSGICETTPNVTQYSGYIDIGTNMSMWFWFFEARDSPETAPFTLWLNGGPGCSSMIGLFQENGPCLVNEDGNSTYLNPYSWNNVSNMIYIDQPIGTGFSYGTDPVNSTEAAAPFVWKAFQILFESNIFSKYASREFIFATESYGGHYGPSFVTGEPVVVTALMINNGWYDPLIQNIAYYTFATNAPGYGQLQSDAVLMNMYDALYGPDGCVEQEEACYAAGNSSDSESSKICRTADKYCIDYVVQFLSTVPPEYYVDYLRQNYVMKSIGAMTQYEECPDAPYVLFEKTGDAKVLLFQDARTWLPQLSALANSGMKILIWVSELDCSSLLVSTLNRPRRTCNWLGGYASVLAMDWYGNETLHATPLTNITLDGTPIAAVANVDNFSFARVYASGHEVPAFQPAAAFEIFKQVINNEPLHSV